MTGGGDCPGLNAAIRAVVRIAINYYKLEVIGVRNGFEGLITNDTYQLTTNAVRGILRVGGTVLGSSNRTNPFRYPDANGEEIDASEQAYRNIKALNVDGLVVIGGDGTLLLSGMFADRYDVPMVGIPKTIDNDVHGSDYAIGFDSAVAMVADAVDRLHTTAESHHRVLMLEVMGRTAGWIALYAGVTGGADFILIPERRYSIDGIMNQINDRSTRGHQFTIGVVAEGIDAPGEGAVFRSRDGADYNWKLGGVSSRLEQALDQHLEQEIRSIVLGHLQRGGSPTAFDRALATQLGAGAIQSIVAGDRNVVVGIKGLQVVTSPLAEVCIGPRLVPDDHPMIRAGMQMGMYLG